MHDQNLIQQLFRTEFAKMVAVISRQLGVQHMDVAEDIVSETFLSAMEQWSANGLPPNPAAWLYTVARNKTYDHQRRDKLFAQKIAPAVRAGSSVIEDGLLFTEEQIKDSQLQMLFVVCDPSIADEAQIGLALRILCGFSIDEIAEAFLSNKEAINKRLGRAREKLRNGRIKMELPPTEQINARLGNVLHIIYLLFNEGYYSTTQNKVLRQDLCLEALRLGVLLTDFHMTNQPGTNALIALMCFHASRFHARDNEAGNTVLYNEQDDSLWDQDLIAQGNYFLNASAKGQVITSYHLEAGIARWHCQKEDTTEKWESILSLYNKLLQINYAPAVALNRTYALYKVKGAVAAIAEAEKLQLENNHFYFTLLGELYRDIDKDKATGNFNKALAIVKTEADRRVLLGKIGSL